MAKAKGWAWEGGARVPFVVTGPGIPPNSVSREPIVGYDIFPTVADLLGKAGTLPGTIDGVSFKPALHDPDSGRVDRPGDVIVLHVRRYYTNGGNPKYRPTISPHSAYIKRNLKLIKEWDTLKLTGGTSHLYDLQKDVGESNDLSASRRAFSHRMEEALISALDTMEANIPRHNPNFCKGGNTDLIDRRNMKAKR